MSTDDGGNDLENTIIISRTSVIAMGNGDYTFFNSLNRANRELVCFYS